MEEIQPHPPCRKACDLCYRRKMKCDGQRPRCSNCVSYKSDCTNKAASRKAPSRKQAALQRQRRDLDLQARVESLEGQLGSVLEKLDRLEENENLSVTPIPASCGSASPAGTQVIPPVQQSPPLPDFPPLHDVMPIIERYLSTFNSLLPLFHPEELLQTVRAWYQNPNTGDIVTWAVVNVVLALAHHTNSLGDRSPIGSTTTFLNNVQSALTEIIMRDTDLVSVQVLLGMAVLFWTAENLGPALIYIGTALRLAHKLGLHMRKGSEHCSRTEKLQRDRVFWMAYILDRDISLQSKLAPIQLDNDVDIDLPPLRAEGDLTGFIFADGGHTKINFFRARVELASIQGMVYECVYSAAAQSLSKEETTENAVSVLQILDKWGSKIPHEFQAATLSQSGFPGLSRYFCILYSTHLSCRALLTFGSASDSYHYSEWMRRLQDYGVKAAAGLAVQQAPIPLGWQALAKASREYMRLFTTVTLIDTFFTRMTLCAHNSSLISLIADRLFRAQHHAIDPDTQITKAAMQKLEEIANRTESKDVRSIRDDLKQLCLYADMISALNASPAHTTLLSSVCGGEQPVNLSDNLVRQDLNGDYLWPAMSLSWPPIPDEGYF
ncbi:fungal-specific transcription factor domain-containing protein [Nemania abortiva]|nr:fungal-specific transcription factor domain-containing protein [Nemania abortiva]